MSMHTIIENNSHMTYNNNKYIRHTEGSMNTQVKLTLRLEKKLISQAKEQAKKSGRSLSRIVAEYFELLGEKTHENKIKLLPITYSLKGALRGKKISKEDYYKHLEDKYL